MGLLSKLNPWAIPDVPAADPSLAHDAPPEPDGIDGPHVPLAVDPQPQEPES